MLNICLIKDGQRLNLKLHTCQETKTKTNPSVNKTKGNAYEKIFTTSVTRGEAYSARRTYINKKKTNNHIFKKEKLQVSTNTRENSRLLWKDAHLIGAQRNALEWEPCFFHLGDSESWRSPLVLGWECKSVRPFWNTIWQNLWKCFTCVFQTQLFY